MLLNKTTGYIYSVDLRASVYTSALGRVIYCTYDFTASIKFTFPTEGD